MTNCVLYATLDLLKLIDKLEAMNTLDPLVQSIALVNAHLHPQFCYLDVQKIGDFCRHYRLPIPDRVRFYKENEILKSSDLRRNVLCYPDQNGNKVFLNVDRMFEYQDTYFGLLAEQLIVSAICSKTILGDIFVAGDEFFGDRYNNFLATGIDSWYQAKYLEFKNPDLIAETTSWNLTTDWKVDIPNYYFAIKNGRWAMQHDMLAGYGIELLRQKISLLDTFLKDPTVAGEHGYCGKDFHLAMEKIVPGLFNAIANLELQDFPRFFEFLETYTGFKQ